MSYFSQTKHCDISRARGSHGRHNDVTLRERADSTKGVFFLLLCKSETTNEPLKERARKNETLSSILRTN